MLYEYKETLALPSDGRLMDYAQSRRDQAIQEAISWARGTQEERVFHTVYSSGPYEVRLGKPGKEAKRKGTAENPNDMLPTIFLDGSRLDKYLPDFTEILKTLAGFRNADYGLRLLGCVLYRAAYMLDHKELAPRSWRLVPPPDVMTEVERRLPDASGMPVSVFLQFLDALAWNEDVKYESRNLNRRDPMGRTNNLLTYTYFVAMLLGALDEADMVGAVASGRGVARLAKASADRALAAFPMLQGAPELQLAAESRTLFGLNTRDDS